MSVRFPNDECRGLYCYVPCERCDADDQPCPDCIDSALEIVREQAKLSEGYIPTSTEARNLLGLAVDLVLLINKHGTLLGEATTENVQWVTFWLTNILRYLPNEKIIELIKQLNERLPKDEAVSA